MWYEIFKFELSYRLRRPETFLFFGFLLLFSIVGTDFIFQGVALGMMKKNAPLVIAKTMGAITGIFMIMTSMIMGVPILRDYQYNTEALLFVNPIKKRDYLTGRFLGSFVILLFIFSGLLFGMMLGAQLPWYTDHEMLPFNFYSYLQSFIIVVVPTLFFGACVFFVTGMLSKKLLVVYTQGIILFVVFLLTKAITNEYLQGIFDPFSLTTLTQVAKNWNALELNSLNISLQGILLHNKLFWGILGILILLFGYQKFSFATLAKKTKQLKNKVEHFDTSAVIKKPRIPIVTVNTGLKAQFIKVFKLSKFYTLSLVKETSFWGIVICGIIIIVINSVNLGTIYGVDSYPETHFIIAELQEMSMFFFIIILVFYSGELIWKERTIKQFSLHDATPTHHLVTLVSKFIALNAIYVILMASLIATGILFQVSSGYYNVRLDVYFSGFFIEILPFLILYTCIAFFFQAISNHKFIGILLTVIFFIANIGSEYLGFSHSLYKFGGKSLGTFSEMNGYGHFMKPYLIIKTYWLVFGCILLLVSSLLLVRGTKTSLWKRITTIKQQFTKPITYAFGIGLGVFVALGGYIFYNTNVLNTYWTLSEEQQFRIQYEKTLKPFEYNPHPKITDISLTLELYPEIRSYEVEGKYTLTNTTAKPIYTIPIQKVIASHLTLEDVVFEGGATADTTYQKFDYTIYRLAIPLAQGDSITMHFKQSYFPKGFEDDNASTGFVYNGTFFNNNQFPTIGYNNKYELSNADEREVYALPPRSNKALITNANELVNARSGSDADLINLELTIGTHKEQTAIAPGKLQKQWVANNRNYFQYRTQKPIINFYAVVSAVYEIQKESWKATDNSATPVALEIYHHPTHSYNIDRMMAGMKASLTYYSTHFSPYQYEQLRIMEFPRYAAFAQSFPNTIPFSEAMGFVLDIDDATDVDMMYYITAHEVAHQWFGMQVEAANVQGKHFILETLSQYAAMMVLQQQYGKEKVLQFLELQKETYTEGVRQEAGEEPSLALVENQDYVYYAKGALAMYQLQEAVGEEYVNKALRRFIEDWNSKDGKVKRNTKRYATSQDLLDYFREITPIECEGLITQLFERPGNVE